ncbi:MAG: EF-P lysine aminoacylase EpmA [Gammaproteobacteria bacterium]
MASPRWRPSASIESLKARAAIIDRIRAFFRARGLLEVETPALSRAGVTDPHIDSFALQWNGPHAGRRYLHTSPEFPMKRLLAAGSGDIWQIARVFRDGEAGRRHNPEFSLLEWYRLGWDHHRLMDEVEELVRAVLPDLPTIRRLSYAEAFTTCGAPDPHDTDVDGWSDFIGRVGISLSGIGVPRTDRAGTDRAGTDQAGTDDAGDVGSENGALDAAQCRDLVLTHWVEPRLPAACFIHAYPADQAALARIADTRPPVAERFELYVAGVELANGFHELNDGTEQRARFEAENRVRVRAGRPPVPLDEHLLAALDAGLPACAGVALGVDRLVMLALGAQSLADVLAFPMERA